MSNVFGLSIFFVTHLPRYLLQGGHKTAFVENIYRRSRLRERQTAWNMEKQKATCPLLLDFLSFFVTDLLRYLQQGGRKTWLKTPQKKTKEHLKNDNFKKKIMFFFPFSTHPASFKKMSFLAIL